MLRGLGRSATVGWVVVLGGCGGGGGGTPSGTAAALPPTVPSPAAPLAPAPSPDPSPSPAPAPTPSPSPVPAPTAWKPTWSELATARLRPGSQIGPSSCTAGFLFVDPVRQRYYLGTAAHCTDKADNSNQDGVGSRVTLPGDGQPDIEIGTVVFDSDGPLPLNTGPGGTSEAGGGVDFSLIELDPGINRIAHPQMFAYAGPTGYLRCDQLAAGDPVGFYGWGDLYSPLGLHQRTGVVARCDTVNTFAEIVMNVFFGDSGGPAIHSGNGKAIGHASGGYMATLEAIPMDYVFTELKAAGFGNVALATIDGGYVKPD